MIEAADVNPKVEVPGLTSEELDQAVVGWGLPRFRAQQLRDWLYKEVVVDLSLMRNLSKLDRDKLAELVTLCPGTVATHQVSADGSHKMLIDWPGRAQAETVMIPDADRRTACVSSQVGCPVGCRFCASGVGGVEGNLSTAKIVEQIIQLNRVLLLTGGGKINHVVFMGMGEPLANYANVIKAIRVMRDPKGLNIGARKITLSTVGVPLRMKQLADEDLPINLAISLHAPTETLRRELIPWAEHFSIDEILNAARYYFNKTGREITIEYILLAGVNDHPDHARQLARLCSTIRANVNLLRYNEVESLPFARPRSQAVVEFQDILRSNGVNAHVRKSRGRDIAAACGQLRQRENERQSELVQVGSD